MTNFAQFENIEFTAEDSLASTTETNNTEEFQKALNYTPIAKCNFTEEPTGYLQDANVTKAESAISNLNYTCNNTGFNYSLDQPPFEEEPCDDDKSLPKFKGARACQGDVHHESFWV